MNNENFIIYLKEMNNNCILKQNEQKKHHIKNIFKFDEIIDKITNNDDINLLYITCFEYINDELNESTKIKIRENILNLTIKYKYISNFHELALDILKFYNCL